MRLFAFLLGCELLSNKDVAFFSSVSPVPAIIPDMQYISMAEKKFFFQKCCLNYPVGLGEYLIV